MPRPPWNLFGRLVRRLPAGDADHVPDAELLGRFVRDHDPAAFELLVWRHGGLVLGTCRRILGDEHLAEDAFQAAFFVLARKAGTVRGANVPAWLHRVAHRVAVRAAKKRAAVAARETVMDVEPVGVHSPVPEDWKAVLDAEVGQLPDRFRLPVLLCYLQDYTTDEAARTLGVPRGTVLSRLSTARERLSARLTRRGVTLPATLVTAAVASNPLVSATARSAAAFAAGEAGLTTTPTLLATEVIRMSAWKIPTAVAAVMMLTVSVGSGVAWVQTSDRKQSVAESSTPAQKNVSKPESPNTEQRRGGQIGPAGSPEWKAQVEKYNNYIDGLEKEKHRLINTLTGIAKQKREASPNELIHIQSQYRAKQQQHEELAGELAKEESALELMAARVKILEKYREGDAVVAVENLSIDPGSSEGIRLNFMYRKQAELEETIRNAGNSKGPDHPVNATQAALERLNKEIDELTIKAKGKAGEVIRARTRTEYDRKIRDVQSEMTLAKIGIEQKKKTIEICNYQMISLLRLSITLDALESQIGTLKEQIGANDRELREALRHRNQLEVFREAPHSMRSDDTSTDRILRELADLRRDLADLKKK